MRFWILTICLFALGCQGQAQFAGQSPDSKDPKEPERKTDDYEEESAQEPDSVSGMFLACAFTESYRVVQEKRQDPSQVTPIACGLYRGAYKADTSAFALTWYQETPNQELYYAGETPMPNDSPFHVIYPAVATGDFANRALVRLDHKESGATTYRQSLVFSEMRHYGAQSLGAADGGSTQGVQRQGQDVVNASSYATQVGNYFNTLFRDTANQNPNFYSPDLQNNGGGVSGYIPSYSPNEFVGGGSQAQTGSGGGGSSNVCVTCGGDLSDLNSPANESNYYEL